MPSEGHASPQQTAAEERAKGNGRLYVKTQKLAFFGRIKHPESLEKGELEAKEKKGGEADDEADDHTMASEMF